MAVYEIVFSPTGGTQKVADCVTDVLSEDKKFIDLSGRFTTLSDFAFSEEDLCVFAVPSFGGRVPEVCRQRISEMIGCGAQAILIAVYGNRAYEDTLLELREILTDQEQVEKPGGGAGSARPGELSLPGVQRGADEAEGG